MRPATAPAGSVITASLSESQTSSPPRRIGTSRLPPRIPSPASSGRPSACIGVLSERVRLRHARHALGRGVPEHDLAFAVDRDDPVGDVRQDRLAALLLVADALVELGVRAGCGGAGAECVQRLDLLLLPLARSPVVDRQDPLDRLLRADHRHAEIGQVARREHRVGLAEAAVGADVRDRAGRAGLDDVADQEAGRRSARADRLVLARPGRGPHDHLVVLEHAQRGALDAHELHGVADGLVEHVVGIELAGELPPGPCKPLRQSPGAALALVELASLQSAARRAGDPLGQRELLVVEHLLGLVEDEHEPDAAARRLRQRHGQQRAPAGRSRRLGEPFAEAAVVDQPMRREQLAAASTRRQRGRVLLEVVGEPCGELVRAGQLELVPDRPQHRRRVAAERLRRSLCDRVVGRLRRQRLAEHRGDPVEARARPGPGACSRAGAGSCRSRSPSRGRSPPRARSR